MQLPTVISVGCGGAGSLTHPAPPALATANTTQEKAVSLLFMLFIDRSHSDLEESRLKGPSASPSQAPGVFTVTPLNTGGLEQ